MDLMGFSVPGLGAGVNWGFMGSFVFWIVYAMFIGACLAFLAKFMSYRTLLIVHERVGENEFIYNKRGRVKKVKGEDKKRLFMFGRKEHLNLVNFSIMKPTGKLWMNKCIELVKFGEDDYAPINSRIVSSVSVKGKDGKVTTKELQLTPVEPDIDYYKDAADSIQKKYTARKSFLTQYGPAITVIGGGFIVLVAAVIIFISNREAAAANAGMVQTAQKGIETLVSAINQYNQCRVPGVMP